MAGSFMAGDDWTSDIPDNEHTRFFKSTNWDASVLGPLEGWSTALRLYTYQVLADSHPSIIYWGSQKVSIYNEAFVPLAGKAHPTLMGSTFEDGFPEIWETIKPVFDLAEQGKMAVPVIEIPLFVERSGYLEETYFTGNFNPLRESDGRVGGFYNAVHEITKQKLSERRRTMLNLVAFPQHPFTTETIGEHFISSLATNDRDISMALFYQAESENLQQDCSLRLRGKIGVPDDHNLAVKQTQLSSNDGLASFFRQAKSEIITVSADNKFDGIEWTGFGEPPTSVSILPLSHGEQFYGFLVVGTNPRRPIDEDHENFMRDISRQVSSTIASTLSAEDAVKRQERLEKELAESERKIRYLAQHASVAMQHLSTEGTTTWANDHYYALTGASPAALEREMSFLDVIYEEDQAQCRSSWESLVKGGSEISVELRLKRLYFPLVGDPEPASVLVFAFPYLENGKVKSVMSCMTDVSRLKWAEKWQARSAAEAREAKRQQEEFIDSISHEVRNPLSAISQLADGISSSLSKVQIGNTSFEKYVQIINENVEDAKTILHCATHQKRIVDDVLTLSKLDFMLLSLSLTPVQPHDLTNELTKMFEADAQAYDIETSQVFDDVYAQLEFDWILCDRVRISQIFINLVGNAIKFTKTEKRRRITVKFGVAFENPRKCFSEDIYWPQERSMNEPQDEGISPFTRLYLTFSITDTGIGMTSEETHRLFQRFEQANSRTSVKYGGSGLGLFISQKLAEKHGGSIGVSSLPGQGSVFAFYVDACRTGNFNRPESLPLSRNRQHVASSLQDLPTKLDTSVTITEIEHLEQREFSVLLVEDNLINQKVLYRQLVKAGCKVYTANHGVEALEILRTTTCWEDQDASSLPLDAILMDWEMPVMDGLTCSRAIRSLEQSGEITKHLPIISITANGRKEQLEQAAAAGIDDVVIKPFLVKDLIKKIGAWVKD